MIDSLFWEAWLTTTLAGTLGGMIGPLILWRRLGNLGNALSHAALTPIAVATVLGISTGWLLVPFSLILALVLGRLEEDGAKENDSLLNIFFVGLFSVGILILSRSGTSGAQTIETLFGDILFVGRMDLIIIGGLIFLLGMYLVFYRRPLLLMLLHNDVARVEGVPVRLHHYALLVLAALVVSATLKIMGAVLVTSMLLVPPVVASRFCVSLRSFLTASIVTGAVLGSLGFFISIKTDLPSGATIASLGLAMVLGSSIFRKT